MTTTPRFVSTDTELDRFYAAILADRSLASSTKLVLLTLASYYPVLEVSQADLGADCSLSARVVRQHLFYAREKGWVVRETRTQPGTGYRAPDKYSLVVR